MDKWEQEFDEKVRKKLSEGRVDFDEAAWAKMEQRFGPVKRKGLLPAWWLRAAAAILLAGVGIWAYTGYFRNAPGRPGEQPAIASEHRPGSAEHPSASGERPAASSEAPSGSSEAPSVSGEVPSVLSERPVAVSKTPLSPAGKTATGAEGPAVVSGNQTGRPARPATINTKPVDAGDPLRPEVKWPSAQHQLAATPPEQAGSGSAGKENNPGSRTRQPRKPGLSMSLLAAPDLNGVGGMSGGKVGINAGLGLGLHFNDKLSLHSGIIYSRKPYNASPADYHTGYSPRDLVSIAAVCDVIDIPLNLRYTVYRKGRSSVSLNAGLSNYLMIREQYEYQYPYDRSTSYEYKNENQHFMGVGNAGIALERAIGNHMSIGLEPFVKVPLTRIGHGRVRLLSAGAALRLNLNLSNTDNNVNK